MTQDSHLQFKITAKGEERFAKNVLLLPLLLLLLLLLLLSAFEVRGGIEVNLQKHIKNKNVSDWK